MHFLFCVECLELYHSKDKGVTLFAVLLEVGRI
jgi:hypothetical protein